MLAKLLKYDFRSLKRFGLPIILALLVTTVLGTINMLTLVHNIDNIIYVEGTGESFFWTATTIASVGMMCVVFVAIAAAVTGIQVLICVDFYKSLISDEGYLTFTLPVKAQDILRSKLINSSIWSLIIGAAALLSMVIMIFAGIIPLVGWQDFVNALSFPTIQAEYIGSAITMLVMGLLLSAISFINTQLLYFMAIFFASVIARKHKILAAIGCVYGINMLYGLFSGVAMPIISLFTTSGMFATENPFHALNFTMLVGCVLLTGLNVLFYYLTKYMMEKKLNLA